MPPGWLDADALAALMRYSVRQAQRDLAAWERTVADGGHAPRTQRWHGGTRGRPPLIALAADVRELLALDEAA